MTGRRSIIRSSLMKKRLLRRRANGNSRTTEAIERRWKNIWESSHCARRHVCVRVCLSRWNNCRIIIPDLVRDERSSRGAPIAPTALVALTNRRLSKSRLLQAPEFAIVLAISPRCHYYYIVSLYHALILFPFVSLPWISSWATDDSLCSLTKCPGCLWYSCRVY